MTHLRCPPRKEEALRRLREDAEGPQPPTPEAGTLRRLREDAVLRVKGLRVEYAIELADHPTTVGARFPFLSEAEREELGIVCRAVRDALEPTREG